MHEVLVNRLGGLSLPRKSVVRLTDRPDMTLDVYRGRKTTIQQYNLKSKNQELSSLFMTHHINAMHALIKFPEYIPSSLGVMARTQSGTYGQT